MRRTHIAAIAAAALIALGCSGAPDDDTATNPDLGATTAPAKKPQGLGEGTYEVGADIKPGKYKTTAPTDAINCYWARLGSLDTGDINDNGNLSPGAKGLIQIKKSDKAVEFRGECRWVVAK